MTRATGRAASPATRRRWRTRSWSASAGVSPRLSNRIWRSCGVELMLNSSPATSLISSLQALAVLGEQLVVELAQLVDVDADARRPPSGPAPARAGSRSRRRAGASPGRRAPPRAAGRQPVDGQRRPGGVAGVVDRRRRRGRAGPRRHVVGRPASAACSARGARPARSGSRPGRAGRRRSPCRVPASARRCRARAATASAPWRRGRASGRPSAERRRRTAASCRCSAGTQATSAVVGVEHDGQPERAPTGPRRPPTQRGHARARAGAARAPRPPRPATRRRRTSASSTSPAADARAGDRRRPAPRPRRSNSERNSRKSNSRFTSLGVGRSPLQAVEVDLEPGRRGSSTITSAFWRTRASCSARMARSFGVCSSRLAKMPSRPP